MKLRQGILFSILLSLGLGTIGCASMPEVKASRYRNSALSNLNPAPEAMSPPPQGTSDNPLVDETHMRSKADYHFTLGEALSMEGNSEAAIEEFKHVLIYDPDSVTVRIRLATEFVRQGLLSESIEQAEIAIKKDPKNENGRMLLGGLYSTLKMYDLALAQYNEVLKHNPTQLSAAVFKGAILAEQGLYEEAIKNFEDLSQQPTNKQPHLAHYYIGRIHMDRSGEKNFKKAEKAFQKSLSLKPDYVETVVSLGRLYFATEQRAKGYRLLESYQNRFGINKRISEDLKSAYLEDEKYEKAMKHLENLEALEPDDLSIKVQLALALIEKKDYQKAIVKLLNILNYAPESDRIRFYLGAVYEEIKDYNNAIVQFLKIPTASSYYVEAVTHASYLYKVQGKYKEAIQVIREGIENRDDVPQLYTLYASLLDDLKEYQTAVSMLTKAVKKFPTYTQLRFYLGSMHDRLGNADETIFNMKKVIEVDENHVQALNYLAYTYAEKNVKLDQAEILVRKALKFRPKDGYILDTLGWVLFKKGKTKEAIKVLEAAYKIQSDEAIIAEHLGDAYYKYQLVDKARKMYLKAADIEKDAKKVQKIKKKLAAIERQKSAPRQPASKSDK